MISCWNCKHVLNITYNSYFEDFFCKKCYKIQEIGEVSYFTLFGVKQDFYIDKNQLEKSYFLSQSLFHPDKYINKTMDEQLIATENSAIINQAFIVLKDDFFRAKYLLELSGITKEEFDKISIPLEKLAELIDIKEALLENEESEITDNILKNLKDEVDKLKMQFNEFYKNQKLHEASNCITQWQYINKIIETR